MQDRRMFRDGLRRGWSRACLALWGVSMSTVIKAGSAGALLQRLSTVDLADYLEEARLLVTEAKRRAAAIVAQSERDAAERLEQAQRDGYRVGFRKGEIEGEERGYEAAFAQSVEKFNTEQTQVVTDLQRAVDALNAVRADVQSAAERDLLSLAAIVARKVAFAAGEMNREAATENLRRAVALIGDKNRLVIRVNPADLSAIKTYAKDSLSHVEASDAVSIEVDAGIAPGGCMVEGKHIEIDASLEAQADDLVALFVGRSQRDD